VGCCAAGVVVGGGAPQGEVEGGGVAGGEDVGAMDVPGCYIASCAVEGEGEVWGGDGGLELGAVYAYRGGRRHLWWWRLGILCGETVLEPCNLVVSFCPLDRLRETESDG
jgi:hypothetical protein